MEKISSFKDRLLALLSAQNITKADLSRLANVDKSSLSHYVKGEWEAKQDVIYRIAACFSIDPAWLMGYDVPMYCELISDTPISANLLEAIPFISVLKEYCVQKDIDFSPIIRFYQLPQNEASLCNLLKYGSPKLNDRMILSHFLGCSVEKAVKTTRINPESYLPLILSRAEVKMLVELHAAREDEENEESVDSSVG